MCRRRAAHCTDFSNHRCPIHRKNMEVQCAAGGRHIAATFPIIDAQSSMPDALEKNMEVQCAAAGRHIAPTFPLIGTPTPNRSELPRPPNPNRSE